ncbi:MAG TPA: aquaporin [Candidatus Methylomirabilis sp.]|nr:aquaporin [Candidatus Methylomirabilis sp.]
MRSQFQCTPATAVRLFAAQLLDEPVAAQARTGHWTDNAKQALTQHWPEYMIEGVCLGLFMISACAFSALLEHPASPVRASVTNANVRRFLIGLAMGLTAILLIYSPMGRRSGAHMNPATTLTFYRLGKVERWDAVFYMLSQFAGGVLGVVVSFALIGATLAHRNVNFAITRPGERGEAAAFISEFLIAFLLMTVILNVSNSRKYERFTGLAAGTMVMLFIAFEAPLSGMSMNPARSFASDFVGMQWNGIWIYFVAPVIGMMTAAEVFVRRRGIHSVICAKLNHSGTARCIFRCGYMMMPAQAPGD